MTALVIVFIELALRGLNFHFLLNALIRKYLLPVVIFLILIQAVWYILFLMFLKGILLIHMGGLIPLKTFRLI